jgi:hypothetical protein
MIVGGLLGVFTEKPLYFVKKDTLAVVRWTTPIGRKSRGCLDQIQN